MSTEKKKPTATTSTDQSADETHKKNETPTKPARNVKKHRRHSSYLSYVYPHGYYDGHFHINFVLFLSLICILISCKYVSAVNCDSSIIYSSINQPDPSYTVPCSNIFEYLKCYKGENHRKRWILFLPGHSLGGTLPRFSLRFWPGIRSMINHLIAFGPTNRETIMADAACSVVRCPIASVLRDCFF
ncbi:unnamed protein product [Rotaria sordida]|uniref:Uncharacterized protein n=1 Tax=Rotaria sordida TaxID=392033 RepID=A0A819LXD3_9BILA|nr:unnamed protein product [Rotaria sordida]CAF3969124.1 unnamed protein product [Rotaria sordida]